MGAVQLKALGECALETERGRIGPDSRYVFALGLYLVLEGGKRTPRQALVDLLWPDVKDERHAKHRFRQTLLRLRQLGIPIVSDNGHLEISSEQISTDFEVLLTANGNAEEVVQSRESFQFLRGYQPRISEEYARWLDIHRSQIELGIQRLFVGAMRSARSRGDWPTLERLALDCLRLDPLNEEATMARAEATAMRGSKAQALRILDNYMDAIGDPKLRIGLPAKLLRTRIAERISQPKYATLSEAHFIGREGEVASMMRGLEDARQHRGSAVLVLGDAGIGKTRLATEIAQFAAIGGVTIASIKCQPTSADRPLALLAGMVTALRNLPGSLGASVESLQLLQRLDEFCEPRAGGFAYSDPGYAAGPIRHAVFDLVDAVVDENTLLLTIEDVHWADAFSWRILETLADYAARRRLLIVATARRWSDAILPPDTQPESAFATLTLPPLGPGAAHLLLSRLLEDAESDIPSAMLDWCVSVADGNPYYLRELLLRWLETGEPFGVPKSLAELVDRRLTRLSTEALNVFQACVALGQACTIARLERMEITTPVQLVATLDELSRSGLIVSEKSRVVPKHDLLVQAARDRLAPPLRSLLHRRIALGLEKENAAEPLPSTLWECAHHWGEAGDSDRALALVHNCGRHLLEVGLPEEAASVYRQALHVHGTTFEQQLPLREGLITALRRRGLLDQALAEIRSLRAAAQAVEYKLERHSALELLEFESRWRSVGASPKTLDEVLQCAKASDAPSHHRLQAAYWAMAFAQNLGLPEHARAAWKAVETLISHPETDMVARLQLAMVYHADYGDLDEAAEHARAFVHAERTGGDPVRLVRALRNAGLALRRAGYVSEAKASLEEAFETASRFHAALLAHEAAHQAASLAIQEGDLDAATNWMQQAEYWLGLCESGFQREDLAITKAHLAVTRRDFETAHRLVHELADWRTDVHMRRRQLVASLHLVLQARSSSTIDPELLADCAAVYDQLKDRGHQDFPVECLISGYRAVGQTAHAHQVLEEYLRVYRRDRCPPNPSLQSHC